MSFCKLLGLAGSLLIHSFLLFQAGAGFTISAKPEMKQKPLVVNLLNNSQPAVNACDVSPSCNFMHFEKEIAFNKVAENNNKTAVLLPIAARPSSSIKDPSNGLGVSYYFMANELTHPPAAATNPYIRLPDNDDPRIIGSIKLRLFISEEGHVDDVEIVDSSLPEEYVDSTVSGYKNMLFTPGDLNGRKVKSQVEVEVSFATTPTLSPGLRRNR